MSSSSNITASTAGDQAKTWLDGLAKPVGSLGRLEMLGIQLCRAQRMCPPCVDGCRVVVFAGDHGVTLSDRVSPFPRSVTLAMVDTILNGKAAVNCMARNAGAHLELCNVGVAGEVVVPVGDVTQTNEVSYVNCVVNDKGTKSLAEGPAMTTEECQVAMEHGRLAARRTDACEIKCKVLAIGEIGIGNTTAASALSAKLLELDPSITVGPGTGLDKKGVEAKVAVVQKALDRNGSETKDPVSVLADLGGFEIAAMVGCMLESYELGIAVIVDGFIASSAALVAVKCNPAVKDNLIFATFSAEPGHRHMLSEILGENNASENTKPLLDWGLRLGEASGAALCLPLVQASGKLFTQVATLSSVLEKLKGPQ